MGIACGEQAEAVLCVWGGHNDQGEITVAQIRWSGCGGGEKWWDLACKLKVEDAGFAAILNVDCERKIGVKDDSEVFLAWEAERMKLPFTEMENYQRKSEFGFSYGSWENETWISRRCGVEIWHLGIISL